MVQERLPVGSHKFDTHFYLPTSHTPKNVRKILELRIRRCQQSFIGCFFVALVLNIIFSTTLDPTDKHNESRTSYGPGNDGDFTISHSMTGLYSKSSALVLIFFSNLYLFSITHYEYVVFKMMTRYLMVDKKITDEEARSIWKNNGFAYGVATWLSVLLMCICIFDAQRFGIPHVVFALSFFPACLTYIMLLQRIDEPMMRVGLSEGMDRTAKFWLYSTICWFTFFILATVFAVVVEVQHLSQDWWYIANISFAVGEYGYMISAVILVGSSSFSRVAFYEDYDLSALLNVKLFSIRTLLSACANRGETQYVFHDDEGDEKRVSQMDVEMMSALYSGSKRCSLDDNTLSVLFKDIELNLDSGYSGASSQGGGHKLPIIVEQVSNFSAGSNV